MAPRKRRSPAKPPNLAARALGSRIFGLKVLTPKKRYSRKPRHPVAPRRQSAPEETDES